MSKKCKNCGSENASISFGIINLNCVVDGRLKTTDVDGMFFIGCDDCSETIGKISPMNFVEAAQKVGDELDASKAKLATLTAQRDKAVELITWQEAIIDCLLKNVPARDVDECYASVEKFIKELTGGSDE